MDAQPPPRFFCVYRGWCPGIYTYKSDFEEQIRDYEYCVYQVHTSLESAKHAWDVYYGHRPPQFPSPTTNENDVPEPFQSAEVPHKQRIALNALQTRYAAEVACTLPTPTEDNIVPAKPERTLVATVNIRALLRQACKRFEMSDPIYRLVKNHVPEGRLACRHLVSLVPPNSDTAVVVASRIAFDQSESYDDAARLGLRRLYRLLGGYVEDYSHDQYHLWRMRFNDLGRDYVAKEATLEELKQQNEQLRRQMGSIRS